MDPNSSSSAFLSKDASDDPNLPSLERRKTWRARFSGYRGGLLASIIVSSIVLILNILLVVLSLTAWQPVQNIGTAFVGNCKTARNWVIALHLLINLLSSILLGASNYTMQRLVAPTRKEIDAAHARQKWLDIGIPSVKNLSSIHKSRLLLWVLLWISSVPLHLVYNSAVFQTVAANNVDFLIVSEGFFRDKDSWKIRVETDQDKETFETISRFQDLVLDDKYLDRTIFQNLSASECKARYKAPFVTDAGTGFGVLTQELQERIGMNDRNRSFFTYAGGYGNINIEANQAQLSYCLSQIIEQHCEVQFHPTILSIVIACNTVKIIVMVLVLWRLNHATIVTMGDAIQSFIQIPDPTTENCCLMSTRTVETLWKSPAARLNQRWSSRKRHWYAEGCSARRWGACLALSGAALIVAIVFYRILDQDVNHTTRNGFGQLDSDFIIDIRLPVADSIIPYVLLANLPQAVVSLIYIAYNGLFTAMLTGREWSNYASKRASLRVTDPRGEQRSTYFLQLPFMWSIPLLLSSTILHWFVSQAIFLIRMSVYKDGKRLDVSNTDFTRYQHIKPTGSVFSGIGYSDTALLACIGWGSGLIFTCLLVAVVCRYPKGSIVGGTNSAVISAACHIRGNSDGQDEHSSRYDEIVEKPLMWGVTIPGSRQEIGHCSFSAEEVQKPMFGHLYARSHYQ
ncbi:hypothetical protein BU24DRAFT_417471 [Aaosphaeria arxii CBS 175.79]|uniref:DUF6536 domain-containing protein n=1 Tax=Aaosphaeria arxii CBS 175.79 TaxID=1450172 RepID=A0A6A5Y999_9PLEO|nr:uncharacterized protein BU24DRAFT_417471 [Aaosphaeria arxii CBS 175.79]KAF2021836.1 hypothetical protein BU24DRAFT_417471 [Aaosphaeria arxii CBS 175.79]